MKDEPENGSNGVNKEYDRNNPKKFKPNFLSSLFLCWMCPVIYKGNQRDLNEDDLISPSKKYYSEVVGDKLEKCVFII